MREERPVGHRSIAKVRASIGAPCMPISIVCRIDGLVQRAQPAFQLFVAHARNHQQIARPRGGYISHSHAFGAFAQTLFGFVLQQFPRSAAQQSCGAQALARIDVPVRIARPRCSPSCRPESLPEIPGPSPRVRSSTARLRRLLRAPALRPTRLSPIALPALPRIHETKLRPIAQNFSRDPRCDKHWPAPGVRRAAMRIRRARAWLRAGNSRYRRSAVDCGHDADRPASASASAIGWKCSLEIPAASKRMQPPNLMMESQQQIVRNREQRALQASRKPKARRPAIQSPSARRAAFPLLRGCETISIPPTSAGSRELPTPEHNRG